MSLVGLPVKTLSQVATLSPSSRPDELPRSSAPTHPDGQTEIALNASHLGVSVAEQRSLAFFSSLPAELRLMILEHTWPPARVIEAISYPEDTPDVQPGDELEYTILRVTGSLDMFLQTISV